MNKTNQTQAICNCRITARAVIWFTSYFPNVPIFLLTALGGLPENRGMTLVSSLNLHVASLCIYCAFRKTSMLS